MNFESNLQTQSRIEWVENNYQLRVTFVSIQINTMTHLKPSNRKSFVILFLFDYFLKNGIVDIQKNN